MKKLTAAFIFVAIAATASAMGRNDTIEANEQAAWQAFKEKNADAFQKLVSASMIALYADGPATLRGELDSMKTSDVQSFQITDFKSTSPDSDTVVTTYKVELKATRNGKDISGTVHAASVWRKMGGEWKAIFHTDINAEAAAK